MDKWTLLSSWYKNLYTHPNPIMIAGIVVIEPQPKIRFVEQTFYDVKKSNWKCQCHTFTYFVYVVNVLQTS